MRQGQESITKAVKWAAADDVNHEAMKQAEADDVGIGIDSYPQTLS